MGIGLVLLGGSTIFFMVTGLAGRFPYSKALAVWLALIGLLVLIKYLSWLKLPSHPVIIIDLIFQTGLMVMPLSLGWLAGRFFKPGKRLLVWGGGFYALISLFFLGLIFFDPARYFGGKAMVMAAPLPFWWVMACSLAALGWSGYQGLNVCRAKRDPFLRQRYCVMGVLVTAQIGILLFCPLPIPAAPWQALMMIIMMAAINWLLLATFTYYPFYKLCMTLQNLLVNGLVLILLALPPALAFGFVLSLMSHYSHLHIILVFFPLFLFLIPYARTMIPLLSGPWRRQKRLSKQADQVLFNEIVKLKYPEKWAEYALQIIKNAVQCTGLKLVIKRIERSRLVVRDEHENAVMPASYYGILEWFLVHPALMTAHDLDFVDQSDHDLPLVRDFFNYLEAMVLMPLTVNDNFLGCIVISRQSHVPPRQGVLFLEKLKPVAAMALYNAYFYEQIRQMSRDLWDINENLHEKIRDKTKALEDALNRMCTINEEQKSFFTMASHNLKTPLTSIKAASAMLWGQAPDDEFKQGLVSILGDNIDRLEKLLNNIIIIAQMENKTTPQYSQVDFQALIQQVYQEANETFGEKQLEWMFHVSRDVEKVIGYEHYLKLALEHLFSNACKFSSFGGKIEIKLSWADQRALVKYNSLNKKNKDNRYYLEFVISDHGEGIPEFEKESIFNSFHQVEKSHKRYQGNGLGLFMVKRIIEYHNGAVTLESALSQGSTFSFILPVGQENKVVQ